MTDLFDLARMCVERGCLPEAGGLNDQDSAELDAIDVVDQERWAAMTQRRK